MTKLGLGSYGVAWGIGVHGYAQPENPITPMGLLEFARSLGLQLVQYADNLPLDALDPQARKALCDRASASGISIEVGTRGIATDHLRTYMEIAHYFGSPILRVVVDTAAHHPDPAEVIDLVGAVLPDLHSAGITLAIENHDRFKATALADIMRTLDDPHVGICLDTVNSFGALEGPDVVVAALGPFVVNLHLKEFVVRRAPHNMGFEVTGAPAGQGMLDIPRLLNSLRAFGRSFNAVIETWLPPQATMQATIDTERDWVSQSVGYLRALITD
ncbi:MAG: sugar phosphate isomerase/epimerase [Chloroflexi bacterium]|nr:sugar phosphate isomerase/epimerase [Chloroflexota bacterium]